MNFKIVVNALRSSQVRAHRDPSSIKGFTLRDATVLAAYGGEFLCESGLSLFHPKCVSSLLLGLNCLLRQLDSFPGFPKLFARLRHQLLFCCQIDFGIMQLFTQIFSLLLSSLKACFKVVPCPNCLLQLLGQFCLAFFWGAQLYLSLGSSIERRPGLTTGIFNPILSYINLLGKLHDKIKILILV